MNKIPFCVCIFFVLTFCSGCLTPSSDYTSGYRDGAEANAIKDRYWNLRRHHHPEQWNGAENVTIYPIPVPDHDLHGSRIEPTTQNFIIQK